MTEIILFWVLAVLTIIPALLAITNRNPLNSAMFLIIVLASIAGYFWLLDSRVISVLQILVYAGAIVTLLIFVIMLLNIPEEKLPVDKNTRYWLGILVLGAIVLTIIIPDYTTPQKQKIKTYEDAIVSTVEKSGIRQIGIQHLPPEDRMNMELSIFGSMRQISGKIFGERNSEGSDSNFTFGPYLLAFEILSIILLVAAVGAVILTKRNV